MFAVDPLITLLFSEAQLRLANKIIGDDKFVLHLDATGSLLKQKDNEKRFFLYSLVYPMKQKNEPCLPICEWLTNEHTAKNSTNILQRVFF